MNCQRCNKPNVSLRSIEINGRQIFKRHSCLKCFTIMEKDLRQSWSVYKGLLDIGISEYSASDMVKHYIDNDKDVQN